LLLKIQPANFFAHNLRSQRARKINSTKAFPTRVAAKRLQSATQNNIRQVQVLFREFAKSRPYTWALYELGRRDPCIGFPGDIGLEKLTTAKNIVIGDIHANFIKLAESMFNTGLVTMGEGDAKKFTDLSTKIDELVTMHGKGWLKPLSIRGLVAIKVSDQAKQNFIQIHNELLGLIKGIKWIGDNRKLILLGDLIADRGHSDWLIMALLELIPEANLVRLASNHGHMAFNAEWRKRSDNKIFASLERAQMVQSDPLPDYQEYLSKAKLFYYNKDERLLFMHAPATHEQVQPLFELVTKRELGQSCFCNSTKTPGQIADFVELANNFYCQYVSSGQVNEEIEEVLRPFLWARGNYDSTDKIPFFGNSKRCASGVRVVCVGHDTQQTQDKLFGSHVFRMDQMAGKGFPNEELSHLQELDRHSLLVYD
jgi:hypothetical protein